MKSTVVTTKGRGIVTSRIKDGKYNVIDGLAKDSDDGCYC